jgi:hypothetical protein
MEETMVGKLPLATALLAIGTFFGPAIASSAPIAPQTANIGAAEVDQSLVQKVQWGYCHRWRHECGERFGWRTQHFYYCLSRHGC